MRSLPTIALLLCALGCPAVAQFQNQLTTYYTGGNSCYGNLFDVVAINDITVCSFDIHLDIGAPPSIVNVWAVTGGGSWNQPGVMGTPSAWTMIGTATVTGSGLGSPTSLNLNLGFPIPSGTTQGFLIEKTVNAAPVIFYTNGTAYGSVEATNADLSVLGGGGVCTPGTFSPNTTRNWNGTVLYEPGLNPACVLPSPPSEYQVNQPGAGCTLNGLPDAGQFSPIIQLSQPGTPELLDLSTINAGTPWDLGLVGSGLTQGLSTLGLTLGSQTVNIDIANPSLLFLNGGVLPNLASSSFPGTNFSLAFSVPAPLNASVQMLAIDPTNPEGFSLSHGCDYIVESCNPVQGFEGLPLGAGSTPIGWTNSGVMPWSVSTMGTTSAGTGPTSAQAGSQYMYCETSGAGVNSNFALDTCSVDLTQISGFTGTLTFELSRIGVTVGTLSLLIDDGSGAGFVPMTDPITGVPVTFTGPDATQGQGAVEWTTVTAPFLHQLATTNVSIRFDYAAGTSFTGDLAIDSVVIN